MTAPARRAAYHALTAISSGRVTLSDALDGLRRRLTDARDVGLATEITIGTLRWRLTIDHLLGHVATRPLDKLDARVLDLLRLSVYQLVYLQRVPASAVVNDAVTLARRDIGGHLAGFVNAVLRRVASPGGRPAGPARPRPDDPPDRWVEYLAVTYAHPPWLVHRWLDRLGLAATEARLEHHQAHPPVHLRVNPWRADVAMARARLAEEAVLTTESPLTAGALRVVSGNPVHTMALAQGLVLLQDEGSQLVARFAGARPRERVLDVCASPGGKATALSSDVGPEGLVVAGDQRQRRVDLLRRTVRTSGAPNVLVVRHDATVGLPCRACFDLVVVDAPCSGLGTLRRDPDVKWSRAADDLQRFATIQRRMLHEAASAVRPGGRLVYATCSTEPEENEQVAAWFTAEHPGFVPASPEGVWARPPLAELLTGDGHLATRPERHQLDGYFAARFRRTR